MGRKLYIHHENSSGVSLTVSVWVDDKTTILVLLETFLTHLQSNLNLQSSVDRLTLKTEDGEIVSSKGKKLKARIDDELCGDIRDVFVSIDSPTPSQHCEKNSANGASIAPNVVATTASNRPIEKTATEIKREDVARGREQLKSVEELMKKRSYKKARALITTNIIGGDIRNATPSIPTSYAWKCLMEIALNSRRYADVLMMNERLSSLSSHPYLIECSIIAGLAVMKVKSDFALAAKSFEFACKQWKEESIRTRQQPEYVRHEDYFLHITALHARAVFELGLHNNAANILNSIMDNPCADSHLTVLTTYASFTLRFHKFQDTINAVLKAIAIVGTQSRQSPNMPMLKMSNTLADKPSYFRDQEAEVKLLVTQLLSNKEGFDQLIKMFPPNSRGTAEVYAYLASTVKEFSAIDLCIRLYDLALQVQSNHANYTLNLVHAYEVKLQYEEAIEQCRIFCAKNLKLSVGKDSSSPYILSCAQAVEAIKIELPQANWLEVTGSEPSRVRSHQLLWMETGDKQYAVVRDITINGNNIPRGSALDELSAVATTDFSISFSEREMDLLALFATMVKVLFLAGYLSKLPTLIKYVEAMRRLSKISLHQTSIRNEMAYYCHIVQILFYRNHLGYYGLPPEINAFTDPLLSDDKHLAASRSNPIYVCGDSHCLSSAWSTISVSGEPRLLYPKLVTGIKQYHLRDESQFYTKENFFQAIRTIPPGSDVSSWFTIFISFSTCFVLYKVIFLIGEIDCREGILFAVERDHYESIEEGMQMTINYFTNIISQLCSRNHLRIFIHPVPPVLNETRPIVTAFNRIYKQSIENMQGNT